VAAAKVGGVERAAVLVGEPLDDLDGVFSFWVRGEHGGYSLCRMAVFLGELQRVESGAVLRLGGGGVFPQERGDLSCRGLALQHR